MTKESDIGWIKRGWAAGVYYEFSTPSEEIIYLIQAHRLKRDQVNTYHKGTVHGTLLQL